MEKKTTLDEMIPVMCKVLESGGKFTFAPFGNSMRPLIKSGKTQIVLEKNNNNFKLGDVPLFRRNNGSLVLHRIVKIDENGYVTVGDNELRKEAYFKDEDAYGIMCGYYKGKKFVSVESKRYKFYMKIILPIWKFYKRVKRKLKIGKNNEN